LPSLSNYVPGIKYDIREIEQNSAILDDEVKQVNARKPSVPTRIVRPSSSALRKRPASVSGTRKPVIPVKPIEEKKEVPIPIETPVALPPAEKQTLPPIVTTTVEIDDVENNLDKALNLIKMMDQANINLKRVMKEGEELKEQSQTGNVFKRIRMRLRVVSMLAATTSSSPCDKENV
jgi:hypothetical protein